MKIAVKIISRTLSCLILACSIAYGVAKAHERCPSLSDEEMDSEKKMYEKIARGKDAGSVLLWEFLKTGDTRGALDRYLSKGGDPNVCLPVGVSLLSFFSQGNPERLPYVKLLIRHGANPDFPLSGYGSSPLREALFFYHYNTAEYLLDQGANPLLQNDGEITLLAELAAMPVSVSRFDSARHLKLAARFVDAGLGVDAGRVSPLVLATTRKNLPLMKLLLERGANPNLRSKGKKKQTPLEYAQELKFEEGIQLLKRYGAKPE